ncbi:MAG: TIM barrel protein [Terracidiphilus sp.]|nr:TIM barrel protein [Terracidiphilus sp.]
MHRREFLGAATAAILAQGLPSAAAFGAMPPVPLKPMEVGLKISPGDDPEISIRRVREMGFNNTFFSVDHYLNHFSPDLAKRIGDLLAKYNLVLTTLEIISPGRTVWDFQSGPSTIGLVPPSMRAARIDGLRQASDFAKILGVNQIQAHCGFIPEFPGDPLYEGTVEAIRTVTAHCQGNGQYFLMETGQETPTTMSRMIRDVGLPNIGVGLDTANLILYGKANPVDAVDILGPHVRSIHAKDGLWPTNPDKLGKEVLIGTGLVDFKKVFTKLHSIGYTGAVSIERETSGPQQIADVAKEKIYLERVLSGVFAS